MDKMTKKARVCQISFSRNLALELENGITSHKGLQNELTPNRRKKKKEPSNQITFSVRKSSSFPLWKKKV